MNRLPEIELMRLLHGELPAERASRLRERLAREPEMAAELSRLEAAWNRLELPPAAPAPRGFARAVVGRAESGGLWSVAPTRVRAAAFGMLAAGLALGIGLTSGLSRSGEAAGSSQTVAAAVPGAPEASAASVTSGEPSANPQGTPPVAPPIPASPEPSTPSGPPTVPAPSAAEKSTTDRLAGLDYDLPVEDGAYADEGTLADDFWQAFDGTDSGASADSDTGLGSEGL